MKTGGIKGLNPVKELPEEYVLRMAAKGAKKVGNFADKKFDEHKEKEAALEQEQSAAIANVEN